jgi:hypothetical protein
MNLELMRRNQGSSYEAPCLLETLIGLLMQSTKEFLLPEAKAETSRLVQEPNQRIESPPKLSVVAAARDTVARKGAVASDAPPRVATMTKVDHMVVLVSGENAETVSLYQSLAREGCHLAKH